MDVPSVHTLEHLLATYLREDGLGVLDFSPMGCQTGFYLSLFEEIDLNEFKKRLIKSLGRVLETTHIPGATEIECGNYKSHSLDGAKNIVKKFLSSNVLIMENDYV
jgi:S-ribosylhomocysteine lyase